MISGLKRKMKRLTAMTLAVFMFANTILPELCSWPENVFLMSTYAGESTSLTFGKTYINNNGSMYGKNGWAYYKAGKQAKIFLKGDSSDSKWGRFVGKYTWCVANHKGNVNDGDSVEVVTLGKVNDYRGMYNVSGAGAFSTLEQCQRFNFCFTLVGLNVLGKSTNTADKYADVSNVLIGMALKTGYEDGALTGDWDHDAGIILSYIDGIANPEFNPDLAGSTQIYNELNATGYSFGGMSGKYYEYVLYNIWQTARVMAYQEWDGTTGFKIAPVYEDGADGMKHAKVTYETDSSINSYISQLSATCYGDWEFVGFDGKTFEFKSPTGELPSEGKIADLAFPSGSSYDDYFVNFLEGDIYEFATTSGSGQNQICADLQTGFAVAVTEGTTGPKPEGGAKIEVERFKHQENFKAAYNVNLLKLDSETGRPVEGAHFDILETFDDSQLDSTHLDDMGPGSYSAGGSYSLTEWEEDDPHDTIEDNWSGETGYTQNEADYYNWSNDNGTQFKDPEDECEDDDDITGKDGWLYYQTSEHVAGMEKAHSDTKSYIYTKGYCGGHPAPEIEYLEVPAPDGKNDAEREAAIEANKQLHKDAWDAWYKEVETCQQLAAEGGFFHALDEGEGQKALEEDRTQFYKDFISLIYTYSAQELTPAEGYILHGDHTDDIPIETKDVTSSEFKDTGKASSIQTTGGGGGLLGSSGNPGGLLGSSGKPGVMLFSNGTPLAVTGISGTPVDEITVDEEILTLYADDSEDNIVSEEDEGTENITEVDEEPEIEVEEVTETHTVGFAKKLLKSVASAFTMEAYADTVEIAAEDLVAAEDADSESVPTEKEEPEIVVSISEESVQDSVSVVTEVKDVIADVEEVKEKKEQTATEERTYSTYGSGSFLRSSDTTATESEAVPTATASQLGELDRAPETGLSGFFGLKEGAKKAVKALKGKLLGAGGGSGLRNTIQFKNSEASTVVPPDSTIVDHTFVVMDHRVEGEIHINKRDFDLSDSDMTAFDDYAEINGDGTLEGAVYGLFALSDIIHPDAETGVVYSKDDLVAVATTDRDGNASFSAITVAPGSTYDYTSGQIKHTGSDGPTNLHKNRSAADAMTDIENYVGFTDDNEARTLLNSEAVNNGVYYRYSSNQSAVEHLVSSTTDTTYPISNNEDLNGNCWIGRPLILGSYYVKELSRSEGYELSVYGSNQDAMSNYSAFTSGGSSIVTGTAGLKYDSYVTNEQQKAVEFEVAVSGIGDAGFDIYVNGVTPDKAAALVPTVQTYYKKQQSSSYEVVVDDYGWKDQPSTPGAYVLISGNKVEATSVGQKISLPNGTERAVGALSPAGDELVSFTPNNMTSMTPAVLATVGGQSKGDFVTAANIALQNAHYKTATTASPYVLIPISGLDSAAWYQALNDVLSDNTMSCFNAFTVETVTSDNKIVLRYDYIQASPALDSIYNAKTDTILRKEAMEYSDGANTVNGYIFVPYSSSELITCNRNTALFITSASAKKKVPATTSCMLYDDLSAVTFTTVPAKTYWVYAAGDPQLDSDGNVVKVYGKIGSHTEIVPVTEPTVELDSSPKYDTVTYDAVNNRYIIHVTKAQATYTNESFYPYIGYRLSFATPKTDGISTYVYVHNNCNITTYVTPDTSGSFIRTVTLPYTRGKVMEDAGTIAAPVKINERPVRQRVAVKKDILLDADMNSDGKGESYRNNTFADAVESAVPDFRFKAYLKSNLERLYRKADGTITWLDENGNVMTPVLTGEVLTWTVGGAAYDWPEIDKMNGTAIDSLNVQPIYTEVAHEAGSKTAGRIANNVENTYKAPSGNTSDVAMLSPFSTATRPSATDAIITNAALYSYVGKNTDKKVSDTLRDTANEGYTRLLETIDAEMEDGAGMRTVQKYNYEKFFDAIAVANGDKWDDNKPTYTLYKPIGNKNNRKARQISNASRSDRVVQFAIDWYLQDEVSKLTNAVAASAVSGTKTEDEAKAALTANNYQTDLYDEALEKAIVKAENYLKPFFRYNLDDIYALQWDTEAAGGTDGNTRTLSASAANTKADGNDEYYNTSAYLPYGAYIVVEQQPGYTGTDLTAIDYLQKHYEKDKPKEVLVPSVYQGTVNNTADNYSEKYEYKYSASNEHWASRDYLIRFGEEWNQNETGTDKHVIRAHSYYGNYEVYPYGLDIDKITGSVSSGAYTGFSVTQDATEPLKDYYDTAHHGEEGVTAIGTGNGGNDSSKWNIESLNAGLEPTANGTSAYDSKNLRDRTFFASISEDAGKADKVFRTGGASSEDNVPGMYYDDNVPSMTGVRTAYDGSYAQMLVPWSVLDATDVNVYSAADFAGYADVNEMNRFYRVKLRLEKLDSETHENILHDGAVFQVYKAQRDPATGVVMVYAADTDITGSKEFVTAYCDKKTVMPVDPENPRGQYQGTVKAGTPVCYESDMVILGDRYGNEVGEFEAFSTTADVPAKDEMTDVQETPANFVRQNAGYIEFPEPLGAGVYVLVETVVPSGYVRTKPVAVEIYSDKVTYYKEGSKSDRVLAAIFEEEEIRKSDADTSGIGTDEEATNHKNKPQDTVDVARVFIEDAPIKLTVEKVKESSVSSADTTADKTVTYRISGRIDETLEDIGGRDDLEYVYLNGKYQGYAFYKGTLEYLAQLKAIYDADADPLTGVEIVYDGTLFTGYAYVTRPLETSDDDNKYVTGAKLTLVDALQLRRNESYAFGSSDYGDYAFSFPEGHENHGLIVERDNKTSNVKRMYVEQGYAGAKTIYKVATDAAGNPLTVSTLTGYTKDGKPVYTEGYKYITETIERPDTDILFYDLDSLEIGETRTEDGVKRYYGYDKKKQLVELSKIEHDKANYDKTDNEFSIYAFKGSLPVYEFVGGNFEHISYNAAGKYLKVDPETVVYHLDEDGNRDSMVDPKTGMAYVIEKAIGPDGTVHDKFLVWATEVYKDAYGNVIARDKITTSRVGTIGENDAGMLDVLTNIPSAADPAGGASAAASAGSFEHKESGSVSGMWKSDAGEESHHETSDRTNRFGQNMNGEMLLSDNNGDFLKQYKPVYDESGNILYYQRSAETYDKGSNLYDRNGDFVRYDNSDNLKEYNDAAYDKNAYPVLYDADQKTEDPATKALYHRYGEGYVLENTWITSDKTPNDPFGYTLTDGQADIIKRVPEGTYIIEETYVPNGDTNGAYVRAFPVGITVNETTEAQYAKVVDHTTKIEIAKIDGTNRYTLDVLAMDDGARKIDTVKNEKSSYTYGLIGGAKLALYKAEQKFTTDYVKYPKGYYLVKSETTPLKYHPTNWKVSDPVELTAEWTTVKDQPIYLEGIPQGFYILEELEAPEGFVKADPVEVEIWTDLSVQEIPVNDDHTKVEIEKVYKDSTGNPQLLRGAKMELHEAELNGSGEPVLDADGNPAYKSTALLTWYTSDAKEFANLPAAFNQMFTDHGINGESFAYTDDKGVSHTMKRTAIEYSHDWALAGETALQYPTDAKLIFTDEASGRRTRISVYQQKQSGTKVSYTADFEYDWTDITAINEYCDSYITVKGDRRFNYLPIGKKYVVVEAAAPAGYAKAQPKLITVENTDDVQRYMIEDTEAKLVISKVVKGRVKEVEGVHLALYKADSSGNFVQDEVYKVASWVSGSDGVYTSDDVLFGSIYFDRKSGDLRAHEVTGLEAGIYWLAEEETLPYYEKIAPLKIEYLDLSTVKTVMVENAPVKGEVTLYKKDTDGNFLTGATYELSKFKADDLTTPVTTPVTYTDTTGTLVIPGLEVGEVSTGADGTITPYTYKIREIGAPEGYSVIDTVYTFTFDPKKEGGLSYDFGDIASKEYTYIDTKTTFRFSKKDFDSLCDDTTDEAFVEGAVINLYELTGIDADGNPLYDTAYPLKTITTSRLEKTVEFTGLAGGKSYVFVEAHYPVGWNLMKPVMFTVSADGRKVSELTNKLNTISFTTVKDTDFVLDTANLDIDSIQSAVLHGRYVTSVTDEAVASDGTVKESWPAGGSHVLLKANGFNDGEAYTIIEKTRYSDGTVQVTGRETKTFFFDEDGKITVDTRKEDKVSVEVLYSDGETIDGIDPVTDTDFEKTIVNTVMPENPVILVSQPVPGREAGAPIDQTKLINNKITVVNPTHKISDASVSVKLNEDSRIVDAGEGTEAGLLLTFSLKDVPAYGSASVEFVTAHETVSHLTYDLDVTVEIAGKIITTKKSLPVIEKNSLTLFNELTGSGKDIYKDEISSYKVRLWYNATGDELAGTYSYKGPVSGTMKSGDTIDLKGNEFVIINTGTYEDVHYTVERITDGKDVTGYSEEGDFTKAAGGYAHYTRSLPDTSVRDIFRKGEYYHIIEKTAYTDGIEVTTNRLSFAVGDKGAVDTIVGYDAMTKVAISKTDITDGHEIPGCTLTLYDTNGTPDDTSDDILIEQWVSEDKPHLFEGVLESGKTYRLEETSAAPGYAYTEDVLFEVDSEGTIVQKVKMVDKPTDVTINKSNFTTGEPVEGAKLRIIDRNGVIIKEWITDADGSERFVCVLNADETYTLHEEYSPDGYYYSHDEEFTVNHDGTPQVTEMKDHEIVVVTPPEEPEKPVEPHPDYEMEKERTSLAPIKMGTNQYGFYRGDTVYYDVTIVNTGNMDLRMKVTDSYEHPELFTEPVIDKITFHSSKTTLATPSFGRTHSISGSVGDISIFVGGYAVVTYKAVVKDDTPENLSDHAKDDGMGYLNTARTYDVVGRYIEEGTNVEKTVDKDDFPDELGDKEDDANTPVQEPENPGPGPDKPVTPVPGYIMEKERTTPAPNKKGTLKYGFFHGDTVYYDVTVTNTGNMPLTMDVDDVFEKDTYFSIPKAEKAVFHSQETKASGPMYGTLNSMSGNNFNITIAVGAYAVLTYSAVVMDITPEDLSNHAPDDGMAYLNTAHTYNVVGKYLEEGTDGTVTEKTVTKDDYPEELGDKEDDAHTPVQVPEEPTPHYEMDKERVTPAPEKAGTDKFGFRHGDTVTYEVHIENNGDMPLKMYVSDEFEASIARYFLDLHITGITFSGDGSDISETGQGVGNKVARIRLAVGAKATVTYTAVVADNAPENLSYTAPDDGNGYLNIAKTFNVKAEKPDGTEGDKEEYPGIPDKEDEGNTPVQEPKVYYPRYTMEKERITPAPLKEGTERYGFFRGDTVEYEVRVTNTGTMPLKIYVSDEFEGTIAKYFKNLHITKIEFAGTGSDISETGYGIGKDKARIRIEPGTKAVLTYSAVVSDDAPEFLSFTAPDDGNGYLNIARTYDVKAEKPDGTEGDKHEYPSIPDMEDEGNTPVQEPGKPDDEHPRPYPIIWLLKEGEGDPGIMLQGGTFVLLDADKKPLTGPCAIEEFVMRDFWQEWDIVLRADATYYMHEVEPPRGFAYSDDVSFTVDHYGEDRQVVMIDKPTKVQITKTDITGTEEVPGCELELRDKDGHLVDSWTSGETPHYIEGKLVAGEEYTLVEVNPAPGYAYAEDITFKVSTDGTIDKVVMKDKVTRVEITKTDITGEKEVPGCILELRDENGVIVDKWTSGTTPHVFEAELIAGKEYTLIEVNPAPGYAYAEDITFRVSKDGTVDKIVMKDKVTHVEISKTDITGDKEIPGAHLIIYDAEGNKVEEWISGTEPHIIEAKLIAGDSYVLHEEGAPDGYAYASDIVFVVSKDGRIDKVVMKDEAVHVEVKKQNDGGTLLSGAVLAVLDKDGKEVIRWTTDGTPKDLKAVLNADTEYTLHEISAPSGYSKAVDLKFVTPHTGQKFTVTMTDAKAYGGGGGGGGYTPVSHYVKILKNTVENKLLPGAKIALYKGDGTTEGTLVSSGYTGNDGIVSLRIDGAGTYYYVEEEAPSGFSRDPGKHVITVDYNGNVTSGQSTLIDDFARIAISKVDAITGEELEGAVFTLYDMSGNAVMQAVSSREGYAEFTRVLHGEYYIMETGAPAGHVLSPEKRYVNITKLYTNAAPIIWPNQPDNFVLNAGGGRLRGKTGDFAMFGLAGVVLLTGIFGFAFTSKKRRKKEDKEEK